MWPEDWLPIEQVEGEWSSFQQQLGKRTAILEEQTPTLQAQILA